MKIGNIVSDKNRGFDSSMNVVSSIDEVINDLPTIVVGWEKSKSLFLDKKLSILDKEICKDMFWTFSLSEKRSVYENDIEYFTQYCYNKLTDNAKYVFIDPIQFRLSHMRKIIDKIKNSPKNISFRHNNNLYIYSGGIIFGIDLHLCSFYLEIPEDKVLNRVKSVSYHITGENFLNKYSEYLSRLGSVKYIPFLYYLEHES